jgi:hypothetical protein
MMLGAILWMMVGPCWAQDVDELERDFERHARRAVPRDAFPVLDQPELIAAERAQRERLVAEDEPVIGVAIGDEARAYPIAVMGRHELANDLCGGEPIAVSW